MGYLILDGMHYWRSLLVGVALLGASVPDAGVSGIAFGFATGTTGGGSASPAGPGEIDQLTERLADSTPRGILIDKEFNHLGSQGNATDCKCCIPESNTRGKCWPKRRLTSNRPIGAAAILQTTYTTIRRRSRALRWSPTR